MLGGRIIGEGVDGCVFSEPMWPCASGASGMPNSKDPRYVSKLVPLKDEESEFLKSAARLLGPERSKYLAGLHGECAPANSFNPPKSKEKDVFKTGLKSVQSWQKRGQACEGLKDILKSGNPISKDHKIMFISRYPMSVSSWIETLQKTQQPYSVIMKQVERAIPTFLDVLQQLVQGQSEQLIHIDLHTGNIFVKEPLEFGIADFGHCVFRRYSDVSTHVSFYSTFLVGYIAKYSFYSGEYSQVPLEARLLNFCYKKSMESVSPAQLVKAWESDYEVRQFSAGSKDVVSVHKGVMLDYLLKKPLFIAMIETIQAISRKVKATLEPVALVHSLRQNEKDVLDYILSRYTVISPVNTITEDIMNIYQNQPMITKKGIGSSSLIRFIIQAILAPYDQDGSSLVESVKSVGMADMRILWSDVVKV